MGSGGQDPHGARAPGRLRQTEIFMTGLGGMRPLVPVMPRALEAAAIRRMTADAAAYIVGGAGSGATMRANSAAFERRQLLPRVMRDISKRDLSVTLFGRSHRAPILLAPMGALELVDAQADLAVARAAAAEDIGVIFSTQASVSLERCAVELGNAPCWFQLYWSSDDDVLRSMLRRAETCGCEAIVVTVDTMLLGWRPYDLNRAYLPFLRGLGLAQYLSDPVFRAKVPASSPIPSFKPRGSGLVKSVLSLRRKAKEFGLTLSQMRAAVAYFSTSYSRLDLSWADLAQLRAMTKLPILVKGVRSAEDARLAREHGVDGLIVSNHGGRQVDGEIAALDALPGIAEVMGDVPVLFDSGVRSGRDVAVALALGAKAVLIGRPYVYGLALAGEEGVREVVGNIVAELDLTMALCGVARVADLGSDCLAPASNV